MKKEFKQFFLRGNVVDLAAGVVIGATFGTIVTLFVKDLLRSDARLSLRGLLFDSASRI